MKQLSIVFIKNVRPFWFLLRSLLKKSYHRTAFFANSGKKGFVKMMVGILFLKTVSNCRHTICIQPFPDFFTVDISDRYSYSFLFA